MNLAVIDMGGETETDPTEQRTLWAVSFREYFAALFDEAVAANKDKFYLATALFDQFIISKEIILGFSAIPQHTPTKKEKEELAAADIIYSTRELVDIKSQWQLFRGESNTIRYAINKASAYGAHGEPPYEIKNIGVGKLEVRFFDRMAVVSAEEAMTQINTLLKTKKTLVDKRMEYLDENSEKLNPHIAAELRAIKRNFVRMNARVSTDLTTFIADTNEVFNTAIKDIKRVDANEAMKALAFVGGDSDEH